MNEKTKIRRKRTPTKNFRPYFGNIGNGVKTPATAQTDSTIQPTAVDLQELKRIAFFEALNAVTRINFN